MQMRSLSIRHKMILGLLGITGILTLIYSAQALYGMGRLIDLHREAMAHNLAAATEARMASMLRSTELALSPIINDDRVLDAFADRDRQRLQTLTVPIWKDLHAKGIAQFQFHTAPATSFLRLHQLDKFGDDLSSFRLTVVEANQKGKTVAGLEEGRGGFGFRVVIPLKRDGKAIGSVELAQNFEKAFLSDLKADLGGEYFLYRFTDVDGASWNKGDALLASTAEEDAHPPESLASTEWQNRPYSTAMRGDTLIATIPVKDYSGRAVGLIVAHIDLHNFEAEKRLLFIFFLGTGLIGVAASVFAASRLVRLVFVPLAECIRVAGRISEGDLTEGLDEKRNDEIGAIYRSLNTMRIRLTELLSELSLTARKTSHAARELQIGTEEVTTSAQQVSKTMEQMAGESADLSEHARRSRLAAGDLEKTGKAVQETARKTGEQSAAVRQSSREAALAARESDERLEKISNQLARSAESVQALGRSLEQVREFAGTIQNISDEINLLSLNASIEAARAGEAGRGFAVVAQHVSRLADESGKAVSDIHRTIESVLKDSKTTSANILAGNKEMNESASALHGVLSTMESIDGMIGKVDDFVQSIAASADRQSKEAAEVLRAMDQVAGLVESSASATEEVAASMEEITGLMNSLKAASSDLSGMAQSIQKDTERFKLA
ncbi:MAG: methyl-accepting chemotaxis protein [Leptonema illini]|jgi:methyl-accepting chemotaxis protein|uniref:Methyl-accepting chemotaxis protein n=1 Tax=Leptonema illini TaxID=183 RepID=A0A833H1D8_9LEPT|nr:MAG: methyl-accepting chemotaxis protein [Leptonema illini]